MMNFTFYSTELFTDEYIIKLIDNKIPENIYLDYKRDLNIDSSDERKEFLFDICSFANSEGGILVYGIDEEKNKDTSNTGIPGEIIGLKFPNSDALIQKIESLIGSSVQPRITNITPRILEISGKKILIIIIPKSIGMPHMVIYKSTNKFYKRRNTGKYLVDVYELNQMFMQNQDLKEKGNFFVSSRIDSVQRNEVNPNIILKNPVFIHVLPLNFSLEPNQLTLTKSGDYQRIFEGFVDLMPYSQRHHNHDGYIMYYFDPGEKKITSYLQIFRTGIIELFSNYYCGIGAQGEDRKLFYIDKFEEDCINLVIKAIKFYKEMGLNEPLMIFINLLNQADVRLYTKSRFWLPEPFGRNNLSIPPVLIKSYEEDIPLILKPSFDVIWQSSGIEKSINYNDSGERIKNK
jgi:hypothetical protein